MEDFRLKIFIAVIETGSFTKAAAQLGISQPAVSQNIAELERILGGDLFERSYGSISLTPKGEVFKNYAFKIIKAYESVENLFLQQDYGVVRYSTSEEINEFFLKPIFNTYKSANPNIDFLETKDEDADLKIFLQPASNLPFETPVDAIFRVRVSLSPAPSSTEDINVNQEKSQYFDLIFQPSPDFSTTALYPRLRDFILLNI